MRREEKMVIVTKRTLVLGLWEGFVERRCLEGIMGLSGFLRFGESEKQRKKWWWW